MTEEKKNEILASSIVAAVKNHKVCNMTQLAVSMGLLKKGQSVSGSFGKKVKSIVPNILDLFKENGETGKEKEVAIPAKAINAIKEPKSSPQKPPKPQMTPKPLKTAKTKSKASSPGSSCSSSLYPRHNKNPFRLNSSYGKVFDCFASFKNGVRRDELLTKVSEAVGKDLKHAAYDLAVILSAKESNTGARHRSCAEGFWVRRENDNLCLVID